MFSLKARIAHKGKVGPVMPLSSRCGNTGEQCCRWLQHEQGGTCWVGKAFSPLQAYCYPALSFPSGPRGFQNLSPHPTGYVSAPS